MSTPQVSVIIPCYNGSEDVRGAIDCALAQTNCQAEIIVINDGSTDRSAEVLDSYGDRIRAIHQQNKGLAATRNVGIELARGEWVAFLDHDDLWLPGKLESQLRVAAATGADVVYTNTENFGEIDRIDTVRSDPERMPKGDLFEALLMDNFFVVSSVMAKRCVLKSVGGFTESFLMVEDWDLWLRLAARGCQFAPVTEVQTRYRWRSGSLSKRHDRMRTFREKAVRNALDSERGRSLPWAIRRKALANVQNCSAWFMAASSPRKAIPWYAQSIYYWPFDPTSWKGIVKSFLGRS